ncbi:ZN551 protein, partial [Piprites chloris]|nr:ZN551 protein [Piprites chloris]
CWEGRWSLKWSSDLMVPEQPPTRERPVRFLECGKSFRKSSNMIQHQNIHTGARP